MMIIVEVQKVDIRGLLRIEVWDGNRFANPDPGVLVGSRSRFQKLDGSGFLHNLLTKVIILCQRKVGKIFSKVGS